MSNSNEFNSVKDIFEDTLKYYNYSETTINELLTDSFINGLLELQKQEPEDNNAISLLRNFSQNQSLASLTELDNELRKELSSEGYISNMLRYINAAWMNVNFEENPTYAKSSIQKDDVDNTKIGISIMAGLLNFLSKTAGTGQKIIASEITVPLEVARRLHKTIQNQYDFIDAGEQSMRNARSGIHDNISTATTTRSPLVVDLDGDGVETTTTEDGTHFDHDNNGFAEKTSWVGKDDGLLVRDINGNGQIDDGTELFGNNSVLSNGQKAANGFEALKDLDSNNDGVFNSSDTAWNQVNVWKDSNQNGKVDEGELLTLEQAEIENIDLNYQNSNAVDTNGNTVGQIGSFDKENGTQGNISDIWFNTDLMDTVDKTNIDIPADIAALPNVTGFGNVHDLHTAMALDTSGELKALVQQYAAETDSEARQQILYNIIYHWTGVQDEPIDGRDPTQVYGKVIDDTRKLEALEEFMGEEYLGTWCWGERDPNPHGKAAPYILRAFDILAEYVNNELLAQTHYKPLLENVKLIWDNTTETWSVDVSGAVAQIQSLYNENVENGIITFREFEKLVKNCGYDNLQAIYEAFRTYGSLTGSDLDAMFAKFGYTYGTDLNDDLTGTAGVDEINGLAGNDSIYGGAGNDTLDGGTGNDNIFGENGDDILIGGEGNDYLIGGNGADTYIFNPGFGNDAIDNSDDNASANEPDIIQFGEGILASKTTLGRQGYDLIITVSYDPDENGTTRPNDSIRIYSYFDQQGTSSATVNSIVFADGTTWDYEYVRDHWNSIPDANGGETLEGNNENNTINGTNYNDILIGNGGNDTINAGNGNDRLLGGTGNDTLNGGSGDDTYLWNWGDGMDTISDTGNHDKISFGDGITYSDLKFRQEGGNLRITVKNNENQGMLINGFFSSLDYKIEDLYFQDGSIVHLSEIPLTLHQLNTDETINLTGNGDTVYANGGDDRVNGEQGNDTIFGGDGNDNIYGNSGNDVISGGKGDDTIDGGNGADTYIWNLGDGLDTIAQVSSEDIIKFGPGITFDNLSFRNDNGDLRIYINDDDTQGVICKNFFGNDSYKSKQIIFNDGTSFALPTSPLTLTQKNTSETVTATIYNDTIYANGGADTVHSDQGDDVIYGGAGFDSFYGEDGNDTLIGGTGSDYMEGGAGDDTYIYNVGDGLDTIYDYENSSSTGKNDKIKFGEGIEFSDLTFRREGNSLIITLFGDITQGITIKEHFNSNYSIEYLEFADGSIKNLTEMGFAFQQTDGHDNITGTIYNDIIYGNGGNDTISGGNGNDTLVGGKGNDSLKGEVGDDTYIWNSGDGFDTITEASGTDKIVFGEGISFENLTFERDGNNLNIYVNNNKNQGIQIYNYFYSSSYHVETLEFTDGTVKNLTEMGFTFQQSDQDDNITGTGYDDAIYGNGGNDTISGGNGNDILVGGKGNDSLKGEAGDDTYIWNSGDGFDTITEASGTDKIAFGEGISFENLTFERDGNSLNIYVNNDKTQGIQIYYHFYSSGYNIETLEFADGSTVNLTQIGLTFNQHDGSENISGTNYDDIIYAAGGDDTINAQNGNDTIYGGSGNDTISAGNGNDILVGGTGNDKLNGEAGNDTYIWNLGDGFDTITESSGTDKAVFGEGISFENLTFERDGNSLNIYVNNDKTQGIQIYNYFYSSSYNVETLEFADGSTVNLTQIGLTFNQHDGSENISGTNYDDIIYAEGGDDTINAQNGNDTIYGGSGNDSIDAGNGNDILVGGTGDDSLNGNAGNDTYIYNLGDGFDIITDSAGTDKVKFGEGINFEDLKFTADGNNLNIYINDDKTQGFQIYNYFYSDSYKIETLEFADGSTINLSQTGLTLNQHNGSENISGTNYDDIIYAAGGDDTISAQNGNDTIYGGSGNDTIDAGSGNDILIGGTGNDSLNGNAGDDTYIWNLGDGYDIITDGAGTDKIKFGEGISFDDLKFAYDNNSLCIFINNDKSQAIQINSFMSNSNYKIEQLEFSDGTIKNLSEMGLTFTQYDSSENIIGTAYDDIIYGNDGNDTLNGGNGNDTLSGGTGHDSLNGGAGDDTYIWNLNDGIDTINDSEGTNRIKLGTGIVVGDLSFAQVGSNLRIIVKNNPSQGLIIENYYNNNDRYKIGTIEFADGSEASIADLLGNLVSLPDQIIEGTADDDILTGGNGNDTINAGDGYNDITGGKGNDTLNGGYDKDTYYYNLGDGYDVISDPYGRDKIVFGEGISSANLILQKDGNDLFISIKGHDNDSIRILRHFYNDDRKIEQLEFADGSTLNLSKGGLIFNGTEQGDNISGTIYNDTIYGGDSNDTINGEDGADIISGGKGNDVINGGVGEDTIIWNLGDDLDTVSFSNIDHLKFGEGITFEDLTFYEEGNNLRIVVKGDMEQGVICQSFFYDNNNKPEDIIFADGSKFSFKNSELIIHHGDNSESISGTDYADTIYGGQGNNNISGGNGNDIIYGEDGDDTISGGNGTDTIIGGKGNDIIDGGTDVDTFIWNLGDDLDTISATNIDILQFGEGISKDDLTFRCEGNNLRIVVNNDETQGIILVNFFYNNTNKLNDIRFADGSTFNLATSGLTLDQHFSSGNTITGTDYDDTINAQNTYSVTINAGSGSDDITAGDSNDTINAGNGNNIMRGGKGNDSLSGGNGDDTYIYNIGDGFDVINDSQGSDKIIFGTGISKDNLTFTQKGNSLVITLNQDTSQGIEIANYYYQVSNQIEELLFSDGSSLLLPQIDMVLQQGEEGETISGTNSNETIYGNGGNDTINGGYGNDIIIGGQGNDTLNGGGDSDTYVYNLGDGLDTITDNAGSNKIVFGEGISQSNLGFTQIGNSLLIYLNGDKNQGIMVNNFFYDDAHKIGEIHFADNSVFYLSETGLTLDQSDRTDNMTISGTDYDDTITGGSGNDTINAGDDDDVLIGGKGNDTLNGGYGRDTYIYNLGDGADIINETRGNDKIKFGTGITQDDLTFTQEGNNLRILIGDDPYQNILINNFYSNVNNQVEKLQFFDGSTFNLSTQGITLQQTNADDTVNGTSYNDVIYGNGGHDTINAGEGNDTIVGGIGNDILNGGNGDDTYIYNLGDGFDTISESGGDDKIVFGEGINQSDLSFEKIGNNLKISINGDEIKGIQINDQFGSSSNKVETIEFHDGSTLDISNADQLIQAMNSFSVSNSASTDTLSNPTEDVSDMYSLAASQDLTRKAS
ncbi:MAG: hypothetical protein BHW57_06150 [Azospirillum sp. 47_25]|nr:MAG: hypothetical protein BHW57_06150 [Azospirillum sp. 47_25]